MIVKASGPRSSGPKLTAYTIVPVPFHSVFDDEHWKTYLAEPNRISGAATVLAEESNAPQAAILLEGTTGAKDPLQGGFGLEPSQPSDWLLATNAAMGGGLEGRSEDARARLAATKGGNQRSEQAVERGLAWLLAHQLENGSWNFNHHQGPCQGLCRNPGTEPSTTAATAISLLAFLGAGYTHLGGEHQQAVKQGLYYLSSRALLTPEGADLQEGTMYAQGLSTIALCEAFAMTEDPALEHIAQSAIDFIIYAQDRKGGGWRYVPGQPGDTTVTGWQLMALKSAQMAGLKVSSPTVFLAERFLDSVQCEEGAMYGYMSTDPRKTTTAIGLLCRMYTGWRRSNLALQRGIAYLSDWGPSEDNMYYNYYATQVMYHWGGSDWEQWNPRMRDYLLATQAASGHESGSWYFSGGRAESGGRLYNTAMAVMTLEVYYRYMPLYGEGWLHQGH